MATQRKKTPPIVFKSTPQSPGKQTFTLAAFIKIVQSGKATVIFGKDFVVMNRKTYDKLISKQPQSKGKRR